MKSFINNKSLWFLRMILIVTILSIIIAFCYNHKKYNSYSVQVQGNVTKVTAKQYEEDGNEYYIYNVHYQFNKDNKTYQGKQKIQRKVREGDSITIYYNPKNPQKNCLQRTEEPWELVIVTLISLIIWIIECKYIETHFKQKKWKKKEDEIQAEIAINNIPISIFILVFFLSVLYMLFLFSKQKLLLEILFIITYFLISLGIAWNAFKRNKILKQVLNNNSILEDLKNNIEIKFNSNNSICITKDYLIDIGYHIKKISYKDILLASVETYPGEEGPTTYNVLIITKDFKKQRIGGDIYFQTQQRVVDEIKKQVPNLLEGYKENKKRIKKMKKEKKKKKKH